MTAATTEIPISSWEILWCADGTPAGRGPAEVTRMLGCNRSAAVEAIRSASSDPSVRRTPSACRWRRLLRVADKIVRTVVPDPDELDLVSYMAGHP